MRCVSIFFTVRCGAILVRGKFIRCGAVRLNRTEPHRTVSKNRTVKSLEINDTEVYIFFPYPCGALVAIYWCQVIVIPVTSTHRPLYDTLLLMSHESQDTELGFDIETRKVWVR